MSHSSFNNFFNQNDIIFILNIYKLCFEKFGKRDLKSAYNITYSSDIDEKKIYDYHKLKNQMNHDDFFLKKDVTSRANNIRDVFCLMRRMYELEIINNFEIDEKDLEDFYSIFLSQYEKTQICQLFYDVYPVCNHLLSLYQIRMGVKFTYEPSAFIEIFNEKTKRNNCYSYHTIKRDNNSNLVVKKTYKSDIVCQKMCNLIKIPGDYLNYYIYFMNMVGVNNEIYFRFIISPYRDCFLSNIFKNNKKQSMLHDLIILIIFNRSEIETLSDFCTQLSKNKAAAPISDLINYDICHFIITTLLKNIN